MNKRVFICCAVAIFHLHAWAQFNAPRAYTNTPVGLNQLELAYTYVHSDTSIDTSLIITGAKINLNQGIIDYTRYFGLAHRLAWVEPTLPIANLSGSISGTGIGGSTTGTGDTSYQLGILLLGGPALSVAQFETYEPTTTVGVSFTLTAPTGLYNSDKLLNLGSSRWAFKPEIALTQPFGRGQKWEFDAYGNVYFYTDNTSYRGIEVLRQDALPGVEAHLSYSFTNNLWASLDTRYSSRGDTSINGVDQNNAQQNFILGTEVSISLNARNSIILEYGKAAVHHNGSPLGGFSVKYDYLWGKGYK